MLRKINSINEIEEILKERVKEIPLNKIPHYGKLKGVREASFLIKETIKENKFITVIGDYDVDGITSSAIMTKFFKDIGYEKFEVLIPDRFKEGYGISPKILERMNPETSLVITVDNGITGYEAFHILKEKKIKTVLTDHHTPKKDEKGNIIIPEADIIINPKAAFDYEMKEICGAEVAWYLVAGLKNESGFNVDLKDYFDYLALAIIADVMPLIDMNRSLVIVGLHQIQEGMKPFSRVLKEMFPKIDSSVVAFQIAPRLNATGRLGKADKALKFLLASSYAEAYEFFSELTNLNELRKELQDDIKETMEPIVYDRFVFAVGDYHPGIIGIVASKLVEKYKKPCIIFNKNNGILKGSGRSLGNVDLFKLINPLKELYVKFGGHPGACGVSIKEEMFETFAKTVDKRSKELFNEKDYFIEENVVGEIDFELIDENLLKTLEKYEPYGFGNPTPLFVTRNIKIEAKEIIKDKFLKMILNKGGYIVEGIIFEKLNMKKNIKKLKYSVKRGFYGNPSLIIKDIN